MAPLLQSLPCVARSRASVLLTGESGTGKELVVKALHALSGWATGKLVPINCGAIPENLLESVLFGHERGAFTGADRASEGRLEAANLGTLFLDEIGEMPLPLQVKLLRVLQERQVMRVGSNTAKDVDFRAVAATHIDLEKAVREGGFREDLYFRLEVVRLHVPPLRERPMDVPLLAQHFLRVYAGAQGSKVEGFTPEALAMLESYAWPGNVRELENAIQSMLVFRHDGLIDGEDVQLRLAGRRGGGRPSDGPLLPPEGVDLKGEVEQLERAYVRQALLRSGGSKAGAATLLGLNRTTLVEKLKRHPAWQLP